MRMPKAEVSSILYSAHRHHQRFAQSSWRGETLSQRVLKFRYEGVETSLAGNMNNVKK